MELRDPQGRTFEGVYRIDAPGKVTRIIGHEVERANGVLVSPRDEFLYVADNNNNTLGGARKLWRFKLRADGTVDPKSRTLIFDWENGRGPDGLKLDREGRLYVAAGLNRPHPPFETADKFKGGVYVLAPDGKLLNFIAIPVDEVTNCAFGDPDLMTLFITAGGTLWHARVNSPGCRRHEAVLLVGLALLQHVRSGAHGNWVSGVAIVSFAMIAAKPLEARDAQPTARRDG